MSTALQEATHQNPPSLDSIETSIDFALSQEYQHVRVAKHLVEFKAACELYYDLDRDSNTHRFEQLQECRKYAWFCMHKETGQIRVQSNACRLRWCPMCAESRRLRVKHEVAKWIHTVKSPKFLTVTMSHSNDPLVHQIAMLYKAFRKFRQHKFIQKKVRGGVWFFQIKKSDKDNRWHPHLHIVLDADYMNKKLLSLEWLQATGNSYIIDIRAIKDPRKVADYVSRYCAKPCEMSRFGQADRIEVATVLHGKRLCGRFGSGVKCDFKTGAPEDRSLWQRLGQWSHIIAHRANDKRFTAIVRCFLSGECLAEDLRAYYVREGGADTVRLTAPSKAVSSNQLCFEDFVKR